jgi:two-component system CheB/CheR fusion protein
MAVAASELHDFPVVGIGASAGGIVALQTLFKALPALTSVAFVVVQHQPDKPSRLVPLMRKWAKLPVLEAADGVKLECGNIYVAPPGRGLWLENGVFATRRVNSSGARAGLDTIDSLFDSLARELRSKAVAVVLSGSGADGAAGAVRIKQAGGVVLVQAPASALHDSMPNAVIASGVADRVLPVGELARELVICTSPGFVRDACGESWASDATTALDGMIELIRNKSGFDLTGYKTTPLVWRIQRRMEYRSVPSFSEYEALLRDDAAELETLIRGIPIHVTEFFRDFAVWKELQQQVIPRLFQDARGRPVRAWTPACASGEEAYSLAVLLAEYASATSPADFQLFATDVSAEMVARASRGIFRMAAVKNLSDVWRQQHFYMADGAMRVRRELREKMVFAPQDLLADPPFAGMDLVTCRNLLIYLEEDAAARVVHLLHSSLRIGGYLVLGKSESLLLRQRGFKELKAGMRIYCKTGEAPGHGAEAPRWRVRLRKSEPNSATVAAHVHQALVEKNELPAVLVDDKLECVRFFGDVAQYMRVRAGEPSLNLLKLLHPSLTPHFESAAREVLESSQAAARSGLADPVGGGFTLSLRVTPLPTPDEEEVRFLVSFADSSRESNAPPGTDAGSHADAGGPDPVNWREELRVSNEELEASREELMALNEELRAANDQLNTANDNLNVANDQLKMRVAELAVQSNVLSSGAVMTLFLDEDLRVQWFTPALCELFPLQRGDIGRRITDLARKFEDDGFVQDVHSVMRTGGLRETEVRGAGGKSFVRGIRPYRGTSGATGGVAVTFTDISDQKRAEQALHEHSTWLRAQREALESALNGAALETSLDVLVNSVVETLGPGTRAAFYLANEDNTSLHHVVGMAADYAQAVDGFRIGPESLACGLATHRGEPVITPDVRDDPIWEPWRWLAERFGYRGCWSFPIHTTAGKFVGTLAIYTRDPRQATERDQDLAALLTNTAAIIIARRKDAEVRKRVEDALRRSEEKYRKAFESMRERTSLG